MTASWIVRPPSSGSRRGAYICKEWELRITARCLDEDLNAAPDADFDTVRGLEIVKALIAPTPAATPPRPSSETRD